MKDGSIRKLSFAETVCRRPGMFTPTASVREVVSLFHGCELATTTPAHGVMLAAFDGSAQRTLDWWGIQIGQDRRSRFCPREFCDGLVKHFGSDSIALQAAVGFLETLDATE